MTDVPALHRLIEASVRRLQANDYMPAQIEGALGHALGLDTQLVTDQHYFVAEIQNADGNMQLIACGGWSNRKTLFGSDHGPNRQDEFLDPATEAAKIHAIFVHPDWARRGLGSLVLNHCEDAAAAAGFTRLEMGSTLIGRAPLQAEGLCGTGTHRHSPAERRGAAGGEDDEDAGKVSCGGRCRIRTCDFHRVKVALYR
jgi:GNAT superfamily N-acetyltransferase